MYPDYKPYPKSCTHPNPPTLLLAPRLPNPHEPHKTTQTKTPLPSYPTQSPLKALSIYAPERVILAAALL